MQNAGDEEKGILVYQRGKKLNEEYYIVSVHDNQEKATVTFTAYELESSDSFALSYSYSELDALFKHNAELANPAMRDLRYEWVVDRIDFVSDGTGGAKRLTLASEPTPEDIDGTELSKGSKKIPTTSMTYAERQKARQEVERLEEKRSQMIAQKAEKARKAFLAELQEKRRLEQLKAAARMQRIGEERNERREREAMQKRIKEEKNRRYEENDKKRQERVVQLESERHTRDLGRIMDIIQQDLQAKKALSMLLDEARERKREADEARQVAELENKAKLVKLDGRREDKISERLERQQNAKEMYLMDRQKTIDALARERQEKQERKATCLYEKAAERATQLKAKQEKAESWERMQDQRTRAELKREHDRSMLAFSHIEDLRSQHQKDLAAASARKNAALEERKAREAQEAEVLGEKQKLKSELEQKRNRAIGAREATREQNNSAYVDTIRNEKTQKALEAKEKAAAIEAGKAKARDQRQEDRKARKDQEDSIALLNSSRGENITAKEKVRDQKIVEKIKLEKEEEAKKQLETEAHKKNKKLLEAEKVAKAREETEQKKQEWERLEKARADNIVKKEEERTKKEQARIQDNKAAKAP